MSKITRRKFITDVGLTALALPALPSFVSCKPPSDEISKYRVMEEKKNGKLGIALVGLGSYATHQLAPALQETEHCYLAGIVTGTPSKISDWQSRYKIPDANIYNYQNFDNIGKNPDIDIVYVVLPNFMHAEFTIRGAEAGKHVICEKPMAITVDDCDRMISACEKAGKKLSIGYRLHFEPHNREMVRLGTGKVFGEIRSMSAGYGFHAGDPDQWRLKKKLAGGGPLMDVGIYCVQGFCYTTGFEPIAVTAKEGFKTDPQKFKEVEESLTFELQMPGNIACHGSTSYADNMNFLLAEAEKGKFELTSAFGYSGQQGHTPSGAMRFPHINQQAKQMDDFALAIKNNRTTPVPGEMGRRDIKILQGIYAAMESGQKIKL